MRAWSLLLFQNVIERGLFTVVVPGGTCALVTAYGCLLLAVQEDEQPSCVLEREAQLTLLAAPFMRGRHFFKDQQNVQERTAHLHASPEWTNIPAEVVRLFAYGAGTGVSGTQKVSLCDATICLVASDFFVYSLARRPTGGHQPTSHKYCAHWVWFCRKVPTVSIDTLVLLASTPGLNLRTRRFLR